MTELPPPSGRLPMPSHAILWLLGSILGMGLAVATYLYLGSLPLAIFMFSLGPGIVGYMLPNLLTRPHRLLRALYYVVLLAASGVLLYGIFALTGSMWAAVAVTVIAGRSIVPVVGDIFFAGIYADEVRASRGWLRAGAWGDPRPCDRVPR